MYGHIKLLEHVKDTLMAPVKTLVGCFGIQELYKEDVSFSLVLRFVLYHLNDTFTARLCSTTAACMFMVASVSVAVIIVTIFGSLTFT